MRPLAILGARAKSIDSVTKLVVTTALTEDQRLLNVLLTNELTLTERFNFKNPKKHRHFR